MSMEEEKKGKIISVSNIRKGWITSILGTVLMLMSITAVILEWFFGVKTPATPQNIAIVFGLGFVLLVMTDNLKSYIDVFVRKKIGDDKTPPPAG